jgi:hypothetical protein
MALIFGNMNAKEPRPARLFCCVANDGAPAECFTASGVGFTRR